MLPDEIELPSARDFCREKFHNDKGQCCFIGWQEELLPSLTSNQLYKFTTVAITVAQEMELERIPSYNTRAVAAYNDHEENTTSRLSKWFERTIARFGYDVE